MELALTSDKWHLIRISIFFVFDVILNLYCNKFQLAFIGKEKINIIGRFVTLIQPMKLNHNHSVSDSEKECHVIRRRTCAGTEHCGRSQLVARIRAFR